MAKLLIITQVVDAEDPVLGFFVRWIEEFAKHAERVEVICLKKGTYALPGNVRVHSLGKEEGVSRLTYLYRFYAYIFGLRKEYSSVFIHMNQIYALLGGIVWKLAGTRTVLWYVHRTKSISLFLAEKLVDTIVTSSPESFRIQSNKVQYVGHGIDTERFPEVSYVPTVPKVIRYIGRITPIKNIETFIEAARILATHTPGMYTFEVIGGTVTTKDRGYEEKLKEKAHTDLAEVFTFKPAVAQNALPEVYATSYATVNLSPTGGMDKTVLESLVSARPVFVCNEAFAEVFGAYTNTFLFPFSDGHALAQKIEAFALRADKEAMTKEISGKVRKKYALSTLIASLFEKVVTNATM